MNDKKVVFIDMDGVLVNYEDYMKEHSSPKFEDMKPIEGSIDAFKELNKKFDVYIVSAPPLKYDLMGPATFEAKIILCLLLDFFSQFPIIISV